jgi:WD40 repeat protein
VKIWDSHTGTLLEELADPEWIPDGTPSPAFEPTRGSLIISCFGSYRVWETNSWTPGVRVPRADQSVVTISHGAGLLAIRTGQTSIQLRDVATGEVLATLQSPVPSHVVGLAFSPDDTQLAVVHYLTRELLIWDLRLIREQLAKMGMDWARPPFPPEANQSPFKLTSATVIGEEPGAAPRPPPGQGPAGNQRVDLR